MRDTDEDVDADIGCAGFYLPKVGATRTRHEGEATLGYALRLAHGFDFTAEGYLFAGVSHSEKSRCDIV